MYYAIDSSEGMIFPNLNFLFSDFHFPFFCFHYIKWKTLIKNFEFCYENFSSFSNILKGVFSFPLQSSDQ